MKSYLETAHRILEGERISSAAHSPEKRPVPWPLSRGRDGVLLDPDRIWTAVGRNATLTATPGRAGRLVAIVYDTRARTLRCRLTFDGGRSVTAWPEEVEIGS